MDVRQADRIADSLEEMVFAGVFEQGQRLDEARLAKEFGVSRTPVREALHRLVSADLAKQLPRRGVFVQHPNETRLVEMFETMAEVEGVCGRLATQRISAQQLDALKSINRDCAEAIRNNDPGTYSHHNERFHHVIYRASGNGFLESEALRLYRRLKPFRRVQLRKHGRMAASAAEHDRLIDAMANGKEDVAAGELRNHVATQGTQFYEQMAMLRARQEQRAAG